MQTVVYCLAAIPVVSTALSIIVYFTGDRSGLSGRYGHMDDNPRIKDHEGE
jgi:hypothetical protein